MHKFEDQKKPKKKMEIVVIYSLLIVVIDCVVCGTIPFDSIMNFSLVYSSIKEAEYNMKVLQLGFVTFPLLLIVCVYAVSIVHAVVRHLEPNCTKRIVFAMYGEAKLTGYFSPLLTLWLAVRVLIAHTLLFIVYVAALELTGGDLKLIAPLVCLSSLVDMVMIGIEHCAIVNDGHGLLFVRCISWYMWYGKESFTTARISRCQSWRWPLLDHFLFTSVPDSTISLRDLVPLAYHFRSASPAFYRASTASDTIVIVDSDDDDDDQGVL